jgi:hypothetical protein
VPIVFSILHAGIIRDLNSLAFAGSEVWNIRLRDVFIRLLGVIVLGIVHDDPASKLKSRSRPATWS